jgi:glycerate 2-kinase
MSRPADDAAGTAPVPRYTDREQHVRAFVDSALAAANPARALEANWPPALDEARRKVVVGAGKAALEMALKLDELCKGDLAGGAVAVVPERLERLDVLPASFTAYPTSHPLPDERNVEAARSIARVAREAGEGDTLIALISGGGSAMLTLPADGLTLDDLRAITDALQKAGAPITGLNTVRKHCEQLKGGGLARLAHPAEVWAFILSDVVGDPLDVIASGPTAPDPTTYGEALAVLDAYDLRGVSPAVTGHLEAGARGEHPETVKPGDPVLDRVTNRLIGSNRIALEAVRDYAESSGWRVAGFEVGVEGEARLIGAQLAMLALDIRQRADRPACYLMGGETTVTVQGKGRGGRNQELALAAAIELDGAEGIVIASIATDGVDGPTDAAGAFVTGETCTQARALGLDPADYLDQNDSYHFFEQVGGLIKLGPTGTNVNDLMMAFVY